MSAHAARIGPYLLHEVLGEGGMGTVYRATQTEPVHREVALKLIKPGMDSREVVTRFRSERQALAVMDHTSIAKVLDAGTTDQGRPYFVMELVRGVPIDRYCDTHKLTTEERITLFIRVCDAVHHAHQKGVVHRDLKPSNLLVTTEDGAPLPKVIDFGIAKALSTSEEADGTVTAMGQMLGTPAYMSPEQAGGSGLDIDTRTDVYALGIILYELLSGALPFDRESLARPDFIFVHLLGETKVTPPSARLEDRPETLGTVAENRGTDSVTLRRELRGDLDWIVLKALEKDRSRRYGAASELAADLKRYLDDEPVLARPPSTAYRLRKLARRHRGALAAGVALILSLALGAVVSTVGFVRAARNAEEASLEADRAAAVSAFLTRTLQAADPVDGEGPSTTIEQVLDAASDEVASEALREQPLVEANVRSVIGGSYLQLGLFEKADEHFLRVQEILESTPGSYAFDHINILRQRGQVLRRSGDPEGAEALYRRALTLADSTGLSRDGGDGEALVNDVRSDLALTLQALDRMDEAALILEDLAASERELLDVDDVNLATTLNNLAIVKRAQGDTDAAIALFHEALTSLRAAFGPSHLYVAAVLESIAVEHQRQGRYELADSLLQSAQTMRRDLVGKMHPHYQNGLNNLGSLHREMGDTEAATAYLREALEVGTELMGPDHPRIGNTLLSLGLIHLQEENAAEAEAAFRRALEIREAALGPDHRNTLNARANLAAAQLLAGRASEAEALARDVVGRQRALGLVDPTLVGSALRVWGRSLAALGRYEEAEPPLLEAYTISADARGADAEATRTSARALADLYEALGREETAQEWRGRAGG